MNNLIATETQEPQDSTHYLISVNDLSPRSNQKSELEEFLEHNNQFGLLGGTTYQYSVWAVRTENGVELWHVPSDWEGRWVRANKRSWNV